MANSSSTKLHVAVIGNGPVGVHFVNELLTQSAQAEVHLFGDEPYDPYNRVALSQLLYGEKSVQDLELPLVDSDSLHCHWHTRIDEIDTRRRSITDNQGVTYLYDVLVLATGSRAHMP
ncbi:MAG: FAD-dependent oxidoreductase, partial [Pseudomonadota bacterium]|nr:FAD-dependent oxidoreductase [Pseudomonadota bacterium]